MPPGENTATCGAPAIGVVFCETLAPRPPRPPPPPPPLVSTGPPLKYTAIWLYPMPYTSGLRMSVMSLFTITPRANKSFVCSTLTPGVRLYSGKIVDVAPSVISVPPCSTKW
jgi:hypothetical protein